MIIAKLWARLKLLVNSCLLSAMQIIFTDFKVNIEHHTYSSLLNEGNSTYVKNTKS